MKYTLDTLPVLDAYKAGGECPLCRLRISCEDSYVDGMLGAAYMEPDCRIRTNETGFCAPHFQQMYARRNRLGLALMTHTHMQQVIASLEAILTEEDTRPGLFAALRGGANSSEGKPQKIRARMAGCVICEQVDGALRRYAYTIAQLYGQNVEFKAMFDASKGVCLPHLALLLEMAKETLSGAQYAAFSKALAALELQNLRRVEDDLSGFTLKFDYRNAGKPWGNSRDAVERSINMLMGVCVGEEAQRPPHND